MIQKIGIIGSGKMGSDIFNYLSDYEFDIVWFFLFEDEMEKVQKSFEKKSARLLKHEIISKEQYEHRLKFNFTHNLKEFCDCDLIIESIPEELKLKKEIFNILSQITKQECIFTSNSSSILPSKLSVSKEVIGMHFFYPIAFNNSVELISNNSKSKELKILENFILSINKKVFNQNESNAFILNRFLLDIQVKAYELVQVYNLSFCQIDMALEDLIPEFGIFSMIDQVGHQTMYNSISNYAEMEESQKRFQPILEEIHLRIDSQSNFIDNKSEEIEKAIQQEVEREINNFIKSLYLEYIEKFNLDSVLFKYLLKDLCGLML